MTREVPPTPRDANLWGEAAPGGRQVLESAP